MTQHLENSIKTLIFYVCYIFEQRNQEGLCWLTGTGNGSDQAHPCYLNPALPPLQRKVGREAKVLQRGIWLSKAQTYQLFYPWLCQEELLYRYILLFLIFLFSLPLPQYSWSPLKNGRSGRPFF